MLKKIFISGLSGNMGTRYALICKNELGLEVCGMDDDHSFSQQATFVKSKGIDGVIIATPTLTHLDAIQIFDGYSPGIPILCEKPIAKCHLHWNHNLNVKMNVRMVNQYKYLSKPDTVGKTFYNFYKTGNDGLLWDCINIVGLSKGECEIKNDSPRWQCTINGHQIKQADMEQAYVDMIKDWVKNPTGDIEYINYAHDKVIEMIEAKKKKEKKLNIDTEVIPILGKN